MTDELTFEHKQQQYRERVARRRAPGDRPPEEGMPEIGVTMVYIGDGQLYDVAGYKHQGGDRGWSVRITEVDGDRVRHVRPWTLEELDVDADDDDGGDAD